MTVKEAMAEVRKLGMVLTKSEGEFRVSFPGPKERTEPSAYYTNDLEDAVGTARAMKRQRQPEENGHPVSHGPGCKASQTLDLVSDHLERLGQAIPREASNLRGIALRLDRIANTLETGEGSPKKKKLFIRPVFTVRPDGSEKNLSLAVCTIPKGPPLVDEQIIEHYPFNTSGREIKQDFPDDELDWGEAIEAK